MLFDTLICSKLILMNRTIAFYKNISEGINLRIKQLIRNKHKKVNLSWFLIKYLKHLPSNKVHSLQLLHHKTFFYDGPGFLHGLKEIFIDEIYDQQLPENSYIIDCGSYIGLSVIYLKSICTDAHIVCFEPDFKNFKLLQKNIISHKLKNIDLRNEAVWIENTSLDFIENGNMDSRISNESLPGTIKVQAIILKDFINKKVDFLKLDIEGAEYVVLKDISENLYHVTNMFIEYHGSFSQNQELLEIFRIIVKSGFKFYIKEAAANYEQPFLPARRKLDYDVQLNIFCFRNENV